MRRRTPSRFDIYTRKIIYYRIKVKGFKMVTVKKQIILNIALFILLVSQASTKDRPNVIIIMADDLGAESIGCYGATGFLTPNIDRLAEQGAVLDNAYGTPSCSPSRAMLLTGLYTNTTGILERLGKGTPNCLPSHIPTFAKLFKENGYVTAISGKWHLGDFDHYPEHPTSHGFDEYFMFAKYYNFEEHNCYYNPMVYMDGMLKEFKGKYGPDLFCDNICDFMEANKDHQFMAYYPMVLTHKPFHKPPQIEGKVRHNLPANCDKNDNSFGLMVSYADLLVGRILNKIDELGIKDNTIVIFTADNGTPAMITSHLGDLRVKGGKLYLKESGWRVPYIMRWPGKIKSGNRDSFFMHADLFPTLAALTGLSMTSEVDGMDLSHNLLGKPGNDREYAYLGWEGGHFMVRNKRFEIHEDKRFYDVPVSSNKERYSEKEIDPKSFPETYKRMNKVMQEYMKIGKKDNSYTIIPFKEHKKYKLKAAAEAGKVLKTLKNKEHHDKEK